MAPQRTAGPKQCKAAASSSDGPAARTRAATKQHQLAAADVAWPLLLQHDSIRTQLPVACKLLCCSKALAAAVAEHSAGQLDMPRFYAAAKTQQAAAWLRKHARLVRSLRLPYPPAAHDACVAAVLAAGPQSLALQSLAMEGSDAALPLLEQLPASLLTHLELSGWQMQPQDQPAFVARVSAALGRLTALRSLELCEGVDGAAPLSGVSALTQLTTLTFNGPPSHLQHAPPQLLELILNDVDCEPLDLRHLAALMALTVSLWVVREGDQLPPNLLRLQIDVDCKSAQPLLPLVQLQQLQVRFVGADITADQLRQLSRLTALSLSLEYHDVVKPASAAAWPLLPLQRLKLVWVILSAPVCQHLAQLTGLTSLMLSSFDLPRAGSAQQLAAALMRLSGLQHLELMNPLWPDATSEAEKAAGTQQLMQAIGGLHQLTQLVVPHNLTEEERRWLQQQLPHLTSLW